MANVKFSSITPSGANAVSGDSILGVHGGTTDVLFSPAQLTAALAQFSTSVSGIVPPSPSATASSVFLRGDGQWVSPGAISGGTAHGIAITSGASAIGSSVVLTTGQHLVGVTGADPVAQTVTQLTAALNQFTGALQGLVPSSGYVSGPATTFLRADGQWVAPPVGSISGGTIHGVAIASGSGSIGSSIVLGANQLLVGAAGADPVASTIASITTGLSLFSTSAQGVAPSAAPVSGALTTNFLRADGTWAVPPPGASGITGGTIHGVAITNSATTIASNIVLPVNNFLVGATGADPIAATPATVTGLLSPFSTSTTAQGVVPGSNNSGATFFLNALGQWVVPAASGTGITGGVAHGVAVTNTATSVASAIVLGANQLLVGQASADPVTAAVAGDLTAAYATGNLSFTIGGGAVTNAKLATMGAGTIKGNNTGGVAAPIDLTGTQVATVIGGNLSTLQAPGNWQSFYSNGSGVFTPQALGATGTLSISQGTTAAPAWTALSGDATLSAAGVVALAANVVRNNVTTTMSVGYTFTPANGGTITTGTFTPAPASGNYQFYTNNGSHTIGAPTADCAIDILMTNGASAVIPLFSGFTFGANTGDALTATSGSRFIISIRRINAVSTYSIRALQ